MGIFSSMLSRSAENPSVPLDSIFPDHPYYDMLTGGEKSDAGMRVTVKTGLSYSAVWRGVDLIGNYVGKIPADVYEAQADNGRRKAKEHPAYRIVHSQPNEYMTPFVFKKTLIRHALFDGRGNGYAYIERNGAAEPVSVLILDPMNVTPIRRNGELWYIYRDGQAKIKPEDIIHIKGPGYDGLVGYDIIDYMKNTLGLGLALKKFGSKFFSNHGIPGVVLERPAEAGRPLSEQAERNLVRSFDQIVVGLDNVHRTALLQEGIKANVLAVDARKAQLNESRLFEIREIANFLGLPPHKLGDTTRTAFASLEQENQSLLDDCLDGWLVQFEQELTSKLMTEEEKRSGSHYVEFNRDALVRVDLKTQTDSLVMELNNGIRNLNEVRAIRNLTTVPDIGDKFRKPKNIGIMGEEPKEPVPPLIPAIMAEPIEEGTGDPPMDRAAACMAHRAVLADVIRRVHGRVCKQAERVAKKPADWMSFVNHDMTAASRATWREWTAVAVNAAQASGFRASADWAAYEKRMEDELAAVAECQPDELPVRVAEWARESLRVLPEQLAAEMVAINGA